LFDGCKKLTAAFFSIAFFIFSSGSPSFIIAIAFFFSAIFFFTLSSKPYAS